MEPRELLPGEYAVLAMLRLGPKHGYEIARCLQRDGLADVTRVEQNLLYAYLKKLDRRQLIAGQEVRDGAHPPRRIFHLTAEGESVVDGWLHRPVERLREVRLDFMLKIYFLHQLDPGGERQLLRAQVEACQAYVARIAARLPGCAAGFERLVLGSKLSAAEATLHWLIEHEAVLSHEGKADAGSAGA
jgi:PadR family transcriptional regulator AphA